MTQEIRKAVELVSTSKSFFFKNYDNKSSAKSELSTTLNTAKYNNNYSQNKNVNVKEFFIAEDMNQNEFKNKNQMSVPSVSPHSGRDSLLGIIEKP